VVFTLPHQLSPLALQNKQEIYALLFRASAETLLQVARDPQRLDLSHHHVRTHTDFFATRMLTSPAA
jgi:hypothetical protein